MSEEENTLSQEEIDKLERVKKQHELHQALLKMLREQCPVCSKGYHDINIEFLPYSLFQDPLALCVRHYVAVFTYLQQHGLVRMNHTTDI